MISVLKTLIEIKKMLAKVECKNLLWTNTNPESDFSAQNLSIDGNFDEYIIEWNDYKNEKSRSTLNLKKGETVKYCSDVIGGGGTNFWANMRQVSSTGNGSSHKLVFGEGKYKTQGNTSQITSNSALIPVRVYGVYRLGNV